MALMLSRLFQKISYISLSKQNDKFVFSIRYGEKEESLETLLERWPKLRQLNLWIQEKHKPQIDIPLNMFSGLRSLLYKYQKQFDHEKRLVIYITKDVEHIQILNRPPAYHLYHYRWNGHSLTKEIDSRIFELEDGWYRSGNDYWRLDTLSDAQTLRLREREIPKQNLISFVKDELPHYQAAGISIVCDLNYSETTALELYLDDVEQYNITLHKHWNVPSREIAKSVWLDDHVLVTRTIHPGLLPEIFNKILGNEDDTLILSNMDIARFHDIQYPFLKKWIVRGVDVFERVHAWIKPPYEWILMAEAKLTRGIGKAYAYPIACIGNGKYLTDSLEKMMNVPYTQLEDGWVRRADLCSLGVDNQGLLTDGSKLKTYRLTASQLLMRGGKRLHGPWKRMEINGISWNASNQKQQAAREHLTFLLYWGINGGLTGGYESAITYGAEALRRLMTLAPDCKILIIGSKTDLEEYEKNILGVNFLPAVQFDIATIGQVYLLPYDKLGRTPVAQSVHWDLLMVVEPDELYTNTETGHYQNIRKLNPACIIGFYLNSPSSWKRETRNAQKDLLRIPTSDSITELCIRDPRKPKLLPEAYIFPIWAIAQVKNLGVDVILEGESTPGISIYKTDNSVKLDDFHDTRSANSFFTNARKHVMLEEDNADHVPFSKHQPTYADMTPEQRKWYFHLRACLRRHEAPDTDPSYLFVYIYELLNLIGYEKPEDAYHTLLFVWKEYHIRYPLLDRYLCNWVFDFINIYPCGFTYWDYLTNALSVEEAALNCALTECQRQPLLLSLQVLELLSGYHITRSKFYLAGYQEMIEKVLPRVVALIDTRLTDADGLSLLEYACGTLAPVQEPRDAFRNALIEVKRSYMLSFIPYTRSEPLQLLISQILRYAENALREQVSFSLKLRGITLDERIQKWIDVYLEKQKAIEKETSSRIIISTDSLERLRAESNEVRSALIATMEEEIKEVQEETIEHHMLRSRNTPDGIMTDLKEIDRLLRSLNDEDRRILTFLIENNWEADISTIADFFPDTMLKVSLDVLNEYALFYLQAPLIEQEGTRIIIEEDYRDELEYLITHKPDDQTAISHWSIEDSDLDDDWKSFFNAVDLEALDSLLISTDKLLQYSQEQGTTLDLLIDEINEYAVAYLGDLLIINSAVAEEYYELVKTYMKRV